MDGLEVSRTEERPDGDGNPRNLRIGPEIYDTAVHQGRTKSPILPRLISTDAARATIGSACTVLSGLGECLGDLDGLHRGHDRAGLGTGVEQQLAPAVDRVKASEQRFEPADSVSADGHVYQFTGLPVAGRCRWSRRRIDFAPVELRRLDQHE
jgi:hypothetical protein